MSYIGCVTCTYLIEYSSLACIGSFGMECVKPCPSGYHGIQCSEKCLCDECHRTTGACPNLTITTGHVLSYHIYYIVYLLFKKISFLKEFLNILSVQYFRQSTR